jgi:hypothetical protein
MYCQMRKGDPQRPGHVAFERDENLEDVLVQPSLICLMADALLDVSPRRTARIQTSTRAGGSLVVRMQAGGGGEIGVAPELAEELNKALAQHVILDRAAVEGRRVYEIVYPAVKADESFSWQAVLAAHAEQPSAQQVASRYSRDAKQSFRRNGEVVRMQRADVHDAKPTRIEDEFLILRRMMGASSAFPHVTGCGTSRDVEWLSYKYRDGQPLNAWLDAPEHRAQWFRLIADADRLVSRLNDNAVAHRDLNPTNLLIGRDGQLCLIDFDQAVADDDTFAGADFDGSERGLVTNDIIKLIDKCGFSAQANDALPKLDAIWRRMGESRYELAFAGHVFEGESPWYAEWEPVAQALGNLQGRRVLAFRSDMPLLPVFLASCGATVHAVAADDGAKGELIARLAAAAEVNVRVISPETRSRDYDVVIADNAEVLRDAGGRQVLFEHDGTLDDARRQVERCGMVWRGVAGYSPRLNPLIVAASPDHAARAEWLKVRHA